MQDLRIDPEFRDKIPPLTDAEFEQLKENILNDGEVYEPICVWNRTIVDGHNRWKIIQEHPEIPYKVKELDFADKWEAIEWMCKKQLGRRNLSDAQQTYLQGKMYEARKKSKGASDGFRGNQYTEVVKDQNDPLPRLHSTAEAIAHEIGVAEPTVKRAGEFAAGLDRAEEISPGFKDEVLSGKVNTPKTNIRAIRKMDTPEEVKAAIEEIRNPTPKPKPIRKTDSEVRKLEALIHETARDMRRENRKEYTQEDLVRDLKTIVDRFVQDIKQELALRRKVISDFDEIVEVLTECEKRLIEIEENIEKGVYA